MSDSSVHEYDAIIIGTGQAGPPLAGKLTSAGMKVAIVERARFGGTCVNTGCTPSKALVASARSAHMARRAGDFGVTLNGGVNVDMKKVKARKDGLVRPKREGVESWLRDMSGCTVHTGHARFEGPHEVRVGGTLLRGERIFINVGARALVPGIPGLDRVPHLTDSTMMDLDKLPRRLMIIGGGYVALEFAQIFRRFGSEVVIVEQKPHIAGGEDPDISEAIRRVLEGEGVEVLTEAEATGVQQDEDGAIILSFKSGESESTRSGSHLLVAVGRMPNTDDLGLEDAGIKTDARGHIETDDRLQTSLAHVWALGDCNGKGAFTHTSYNDHEIVAANLLEGANRSVTDRVMAYAIYTDPPLGRVGMSERDLRESGRKALIARMPMENVARAQERSETAGLMKILIDEESECILGAALLGISCDEVVHLIIDTMAAGAPYTTIRDAMHIHPTVAELIPTMLHNPEPL